jgi:hypothetical protein
MMPIHLMPLHQNNDEVALIDIDLINRDPERTSRVSTTVGFNCPLPVFRSASMLCNNERMPLPKASLF